ncbi:hypothetical protein [Halocatena pleomorpha]|uniref:Uncharacterized protein n=1 Tax=Halocatena pleomorpha TaxID=1785090 RepID=A0A3P3R3Z6_9EURY|nr:hypothetical protein [Halocatena pleomorpha]RRJ28192.1 hypothetical protein EIK79_16515 [Halocatena pleomorpha]
MSIDDDPETAVTLRSIAEEIRQSEGTNNEQIAAMLYRVSDLYDPAESTTTQDIYLNMRNILNVKERGGLHRGSDSK